MKLSKYILLLSLSLVLTNCGDTNASKQTGLTINTTVKSLTLGDTLKLSINNPKKLEIVDVSYQLNGKPISNETILDAITLGKKVLTAVIAYDNKSVTITKSIKIFNNVIPSYYTY